MALKKRKLKKPCSVSLNKAHAGAAAKVVAGHHHQAHASKPTKPKPTKEISTTTKQPRATISKSKQRPNERKHVIGQLVRSVESPIAMKSSASIKPPKPAPKPATKPVAKPPPPTSKGGAKSGEPPTTKPPSKQQPHPQPTTTTTTTTTPQGTISIQTFNISLKQNPKQQQQSSSKSSTKSSEKIQMDTPELLAMFAKFLKDYPQTTKQRKVKKVDKNLAEPKRDNSSTAVIEDREMLETLNDELNELFNNSNTLKTSYRDIVQSLMSIQKKHAHKDKDKSSAPKSLWLLDNNNDGVGGKNKRKSKNQQKDAAAEQQQSINSAFANNNNYDQLESEINPIAKFKDPKTRDKAFQKLFGRVDRLRAGTNHFCQNFDEQGYLMVDKYQKYITNYGGCTFRHYNSWHAEIKELGKIIDQILQEYNREFLQLFNISRGSSI